MAVLFFAKPTGWTELTLAVIVVYIGIVTWGVFDLRVRMFAPATTTADGILLSFDDGPVPGRTEEVLDVLSRYNLKAMFFLIGKNAESYPELVQKIASSGHMIGNHTYTHSVAFTTSSTKACAHNLERCQDAILRAAGVAPMVFRPPFGVSNPHIASAARQKGLATVGWSVRSLDTVLSATKCLNRITRKTRHNSIVLLHDHGCLTSAHLEEFIEHCLSNGFKFADIHTFAEQYA